MVRHRGKRGSNSRPCRRWRRQRGITLGGRDDDCGDVGGAFLDRLTSSVGDLIEAGSVSFDVIDDIINSGKMGGREAWGRMGRARRMADGRGARDGCDDELGVKAVDENAAGDGGGAWVSPRRRTRGGEGL